MAIRYAAFLHGGRLSRQVRNHNEKKDEKFAFQSPARPDILRVNAKFSRYDTPENTAFRSVVRNLYALDLDARLPVPGQRAGNVVFEFHPWFPVVTKRI